MKFFNLFTVVVTALLTGPTLACKCKWNGYNVVDTTRSCCGEAAGVFVIDDCAYSTLPQGSGRFNNCCRSHGTETDC